MAAAPPGYNKDLFVLPFDHRGSFEAGLLGIRGRPAEPHEVEQLAAYKRIIYDGFLEATKDGVPTEKAAILVDQTYGHAILADALARGITTCVPVEKSGQDEFDFEYGGQFREHIQEASPTFVRVLVRYNPEGDGTVNETQRRRLKLLSDYTHSAGYKFMFELLVPATPSQLDSAGQDRRAFDLRLRPALTIRAIADIQDAGVEPDVWKLEGTEDAGAMEKIVSQVQSGGRDDVRIIVLGRGEDEERVRQWLVTGARTDGVIGFAVGRTIFWQPLVGHKEGMLSSREAAGQIAGRYRALYRLFIEARAGARA